MDLNNLDKPLNIDERYLYHINVRLNILIDMFSSLLEVYAKQNDVSTTSNEVVEEVIVEEEEVIEEIVYATLTKAEITSILEEKGIEYNSRMTKVELIKLLN